MTSPQGTSKNFTNDERKKIFHTLRTMARSGVRGLQRHYIQELFPPADFALSLPEAQRSVPKNWPSINHSPSLKPEIKSEKLSAPNADIKMSSQIAGLERAPTQWSHYLAQLEQCQNCPSQFIKDREWVLHQFLPTKLEPEISVLFVGEAPTQEETRAGQCLQGEKGVLLSKIIQAMKLQEQEYAITLAVKCHTPNRENWSQMVEHCTRHLHFEILHLRPKVIVGLGAKSTNILLGHKERLSLAHGKFFERKYSDERSREFTSVVVPIFHPEYLAINPNMKKVAWMDLQNIMRYLGKIK